MTITRFGKCASCGKPTKVKKKFDETQDMFEPDRKTALRGDLIEDIRVWRERKIYCEEHR